MDRMVVLYTFLFMLFSVVAGAQPAPGHIIPASSFGALSGNIGKVMIYSDSFHNEREIVAALSTALNMDPDDIYTMGEGGATVFDDTEFADTLRCTAAQGYLLSGPCRKGENQVQYVDGSCRSFARYSNDALPQAPDTSTCSDFYIPANCCDSASNGTCYSTCLEDLNTGPNDYAIFSFGTNDVFKGGNQNKDGGWCGSHEEDEWRRAWHSVLSHADSQDVWGVVTTGVQIVENPGFTSPGSVGNNYICAKNILRDEIVPQYPKAIYAESYDFYTAIRSNWGDDYWAALYANCPLPIPCDEAEDGTHLKNPEGYDHLANDIIRPALIELHQRRLGAQ